MWYSGKCGSQSEAPLTPTQIIALAEAAGSPALLALVHGHLNNGHPALAERCLGLTALQLAVLDVAFAKALERAAEAGAVAAVVARLEAGD